MTPQIQQQIMDKLDAIAAKLGVAASALWAILLRQAKVEGWQDVFWACLCILAAGWLIYFAHKYVDKKECEGVSLLLYIPVIILTICLYNEIYEGISCLANPGYWALQQLAKML